MTIRCLRAVICRARAAHTMPENLDSGMEFVSFPRSARVRSFVGLAAMNTWVGACIKHCTLLCIFARHVMWRYP